MRCMGAIVRRAIFGSINYLIERDFNESRGSDDALCVRAFLKERARALVRELQLIVKEWRRVMTRARVAHKLFGAFLGVRGRSGQYAAFFGA